MTANAFQRLTALALVIASVLALGVAWYVQHIMHIVPCELCLIERIPWRIVFVASVIAFVLPGLPGRWAIILCIPVLLIGVGFSALHVGVEQHWWPSPFPSCHAPTFHAGSFRERLASMPARPSKPCDAATYLLGLPLSMAALGGLFALAAAVGAAFGVRLTAKARP